MKKTLVTLMAAGAIVASSFGQGSVNVSYTTGANTVKKETAPGAATYQAVVNADSARLQFLWAPVGTTDINLFTVLGTTINGGVPTAGFFSGGTRTITGIAPGANVTAFVRGWLLGSGASYDVATVRGATPFFTVNTADFGGTPPETAANLNSVFPGLNLVTVPEPTSMALAGLGAASLLIFRRRK